MNFEFTEEQQLLKQSIERWSQDNYSFEKRRGFAESAEGFGRDNWAAFAELGWLSVPFAEEQGGFGGDATDIAVIFEAFGKALIVEPLVPNLLMFGGLLAQSQNAELRNELIPNIVDGSLLGAVALYEPGSRFEHKNLTCRAESQNDGFVLNGSKAMVLGGASAAKIIVAAQTDSGLELFLIDASAAGVSRKEYTLMDGQRAVDLDLVNVAVAAKDKISQAGDADKMVQTMLNQVHIALSAEALGIMQHLNTATVEYSKTREQFGVSISKFQALQHRMVDTFMAYELCKSMLVGTLCEVTNEQSDQAEIDKSIVALRSLIAKNGKLVGDEAIQIHGGMGMTDELDIGHYVKRLLTINLQFGNGDFFRKQYNRLSYSA